MATSDSSVRLSDNAGFFERLHQRRVVRKPPETPHFPGFPSDRLSDKRAENWRIAESLYLAQYIERMGTGTGDMIRLCRDAGLPEPLFGYRGGFLTTVSRGSFEAESVEKSSGKTGVKSSGKGTGKRLGRTAKKIVELLQQKPEITIPELAVAVGITERGIEKQIAKLREDEIIARIGPARGGHWEVLE